MRRVVSALKAAHFLTVFWVFTFFCYLWLVVRHARAILFAPEKLTLVEHEVANFWGKSFFALIPGWRYVIHGRENLPPPGEAAVIVANHQSATDILALFTLGIQFRWLSKKEVFNLPWVGGAMRWSGYVPITRGDAESHRRAMLQSAKWLRRGVSMVFFPEGSRSVSGELQKFKLGAFRLAEQEKVAIVPMLLCGTRGLMVKKSIVPNRATIDIRVLEKVHPREDESLDELVERVREIIRVGLETHQSPQ